MRSKLLLALIFALICILICSCGNGEETTEPVEETTEPVVTQPAETEPPETEPPHEHEYLLSKTVAGTCVEEGYEVYSCICGLSYKNLIPSAHKYTSIKDTTGKYTKKLCSLCGDYNIVRNQTYVHHVTYEGFSDIKNAIDAQKNLKFYAISPVTKQGGGEIKENLDGKYAYIREANYYIQDTSRTMLTKKFVVSADIKFDKPTSIELISYVFLNANGKWSYNSGIVKVTEDGKLRIHGEDAPLDIKVKEKGYSNIAIVADPATSLCDIYVDEKLMRTGVKYVDFPADAKECHIRYFDRKEGFAAAIDNMKMYVADTPEFVVPDGLTFK